MLRPDDIGLHSRVSYSAAALNEHTLAVGLADSSKEIQPKTFYNL
jgi:hypothetical protein